MSNLGVGIRYKGIDYYQKGTAFAIPFYLHTPSLSDGTRILALDEIDNNLLIVHSDGNLSFATKPSECSHQLIFL